LAGNIVDKADTFRLCVVVVINKITVLQKTDTLKRIFFMLDYDLMKVSVKILEQNTG
jgi:hypothetical protein